VTDFIAPGGIAVLAFGPLFHSPFGDHMWDFFRLQIPWRGVLFSEKALLRVRRECFRPTDPADSYRKVRRRSQPDSVFGVLGHVRDTGWEFDYLASQHLPQASAAASIRSDMVTRVPGLQDYFGAQRVRRFAPCRPRLKQGVPNGLHLVLAPQRTREQAPFMLGFRCELKSDHEN